jgi:hypothetical protein
MSSLQCPLEHNITLTVIRLSDTTVVVPLGQDNPLEGDYECSKEHVMPQLASDP